VEEEERENQKYNSLRLEDGGIILPNLKESSGNQFSKP